MSEIHVIKPSVSVYEPNFNPVEKVANMARICYKSDKPSTKENNAALIAGCIKRGHTSVCEHGYMSVYFGNEIINVKTMQVPQYPNGFSTSQLWSGFNSPDIRKYTEVFGDDQIYKLIDGGNAKPKVYPVVVANFRAWLNILNDCLAAAIREQYPIGVALMTGILVKAEKCFPEIFGGLKKDFNDALAHATPDNYLYKTFMPSNAKEGDKLTVEHLSQYYNVLQIYCAAAPARYSLSAVLRTDRAVTHQLVRHRRDIAYSQESQRYVNYANKGYEVVWPQMDPVKFKDYGFKSMPTPDETGNTSINILHLEEGGFIPGRSSVYNTWRGAMEVSISHYELLLDSELVFTGETKEGNDPSVMKLPPETARTSLANSFATTIGVTWTPATFVNLLKWRLEQHAQWPIRYLIGKVVIQALYMNHDFFENFPPDMVKKWINECHDEKILNDDQIYNDLIAYQDKRQKNIDEQIKAHYEQIAAEQKARQEELKKRNGGQENEVQTPPETTSESVPTEGEKSGEDTSKNE